MQPAGRDQQEPGAGSNRVAFIPGVATGFILAVGVLFIAEMSAGTDVTLPEAPPKIGLLISLVQVGLVVLLLTVIVLAMAYGPKP